MGSSQSISDKAFTDEGVGLPFRGRRDQVVVAIDLGATRSAVAVALLRPKTNPEIHAITTWPGQEASPSEEGVPSVLHYELRDHGKPICVAAGAVSPPRNNQPDLTKSVRYFKHHVNRQVKGVIRSPLWDGEALLSLPLKLDLVQIYSDLLLYLVTHAKEYLKATTSRDLWPASPDDVGVVLTYPNLWDEPQLNILRKAIIQSGVLTQANLKSHLHFISEAEAAARFCMSKYSTAAKRLKVGTQVMVCDAGGSTTDITTYSIESNRQKELHLVQASNTCLEAGGTFVDSQFAKYIRPKLTPLQQTPKFEYLIQEAVRVFELEAKRNFRPTSTTCDVRIGRFAPDEEEMLGTREGIISVECTTMCSFFDPLFSEIIGVAKARARSVDCIILTGGIGHSEYLFQKFRQSFRDCVIISPRDPVVTNANVVALASSGKPGALGALVLFLGRKLRSSKRQGVFKT